MFLHSRFHSDPYAPLLQLICSGVGTTGATGADFPLKISAVKIWVCHYHRHHHHIWDTKQDADSEFQRKLWTTDGAEMD